MKRFLPKTCFLLLFLVAGEPVGVPVQLWCCGVVTAEVILLFAKVSNIIHHHSAVVSEAKQFLSFCRPLSTHDLTLFPLPLFCQQCTDPPATEIQVHLLLPAREREQGCRFNQRACGESRFQHHRTGKDDA